jgi:hypothetical protein
MRGFDDGQRNQQQSDPGANGGADYGLGRFPVTLYLEQWDSLLSHASELREFIEANKSRLKTKEQTNR